MAPFANGSVPALAAPTGAATGSAEGVDPSAEAEGVLAASSDPEPGPEAAGGVEAAAAAAEEAAGERQEASELAPTVIVLLQASLSSASKSDNCTWVPAGMVVFQEIEVVSKSPTVTRASPQGSEAGTTIRL